MNKNTLMNWLIGIVLVGILCAGLFDRLSLKDKLVAWGIGKALTTQPGRAVAPPQPLPPNTSTPVTSGSTNLPPATPITRPQISPQVKTAITDRIEQADATKYSAEQKSDLKNLIKDAEKFNLIETVFFSKGGADMDATNGAALDSSYDKSECFKRQGEPDFFLVVIGYASTDGSRESNLILAEKRAVAVANHLLNSRSVSPPKVLTVSIGETELLDKDSSGSNRAVEVWETSIDPKYLGRFIMDR
jgi:outer membrane protein OmpA-like peptidoglycan-associated protein